MILERLRRRRPAPDSNATDGGTPEPESGAGQYDRMDADDVNARLRGHPQAELEAIETHERAHKNRPVVLNKLRYLRGKEPLPGYDKLEVDEIAAALRDADESTIRDVREYERKFRKRQAVLDQLSAIGRDRRAAIVADR